MSSVSGRNSLSDVLVTRCTFPPPGSRVDLAVSGGADSLALLVLAAHAGLDATAYHVDHGLRPSSAREAGVVEEAAAKVGAGFASRRVDVAPGPNLEARARAARFAVLPGGVATGHTADDRAETILINMLRGAGLRGLAGIRPGFRHPILALRRSETRELCAAAGLVPVEDESNADPAFLRNRVRRELLPLLSEMARRDVVPLLVRQADLIRAEDELLDRLACDVDPLDGRALAALDPVLARRAVRGWLSSADSEAHMPSAATVERVLEVARKVTRASEVGGNQRVRRTNGRLRLERAGSSARETSPGPN